ncbi:MAG: hypothetical protein ACLGI6_14770 [Gammaproteobacteria bacterium]
MNSFTYWMMAGFFVAASIEASAAKMPALSIVGKTTRSHHITEVKIRVGDKVSRISLPEPGAVPEAFTMMSEKWRGLDMLSFTLDSRGQIPSIAYYQRQGAKFCYVGTYSRLFFDDGSELVVEPLQSSAIEQIVNRYDLRPCGLDFRDQLSDKVIDQESEDGNVRRVVTKLKGVGAHRFECEYTVEGEVTRDPNNCFRR